MGPVDRGDLKREDVLQAVILAETFCTKFQPLTESVPFALLPLQGRPLLDYSLELLHSNAFQEVYLFCHGHNAERIKTYLSSSKWASFEARGFVVKVISADNYMSFGDMMRDLDGKAYIRSDFLLLQTGVVSNMDLKQLLKAHRQNQANSNAKSLMTVAVRRMSPTHGTRSTTEHFVVFLDANNKILHAHFNQRKSKYIDVPFEVLTSGGPVSVRADLAQTKMVFCNQHVPVIFSDNFDYQDTDDFVKGIIEHEEVMGNSIHLYEVNDAYCSCVTNLTMYSRMALDVAKRWTYPHTVEMYIRDCNLQRDGYYVASQGRIAHSAKIGHFSVVLGSVAEEVKITRSFIGEGSSIGVAACVHEATLGKNVTIEDNCSLNYCLIGDNCIVYKGTSLTRCVIAADVRVGPGVTLEDVRLQSFPYDDGFGDELDGHTAEGGERSSTCDTARFGTKSVAFEFSEERDDDSEDEDDAADILEDRWGAQNEGGFSDGFVSEVEDDGKSEISTVGDGDEIDGGLDATDGTEDTNRFFREVLESLQRGIEENIKPQNLILEINSSKHAYNVTISEVIEITVRALLSLCIREEATGEAFMAALKKSANQISGILRNYLKKEDSQRICLEEIDRFYERLRPNCDENMLKTMQNLINFLYQRDILSEEAIIEWYIDLDDKVTKKYMKQFVQWLQQDNSDEEEDTEDESSEADD
ncbi:translation initiation factor eIF-2B subunit epsilon-like [Tropilaelaps mercedesae]|uniref:Translation initiation factor eIF2B subunit epsilon n=1 Tax=Tropilaelaps mercedesae TaxID=418985 RepID=A0A1V9XC53_9ACAR|nr:translation initiation factor eIF-2B subunit epsilon-like [Tropilaelaps mercedesae]